MADDDQQPHYLTSAEFFSARLEFGLNMEYDTSFLAKKQYFIRQNILESIKSNYKNTILEKLMELYGENIYHFNSNIIGYVGEIVLEDFMMNESSLFRKPINLTDYKQRLQEIAKTKPDDIQLIFIYLQNIVITYNKKVNIYNN